MIFHFQTSSINWSDEDREYFETKLLTLTKYLGNEAGDEDTVDMRVVIESNKHHAGNRFEVKGTMTCSHHGKFHAEVAASTFKEGADFLHDKLKIQVTKFHEKHKR